MKSFFYTKVWGEHFWEKYPVKFLWDMVYLVIRDGSIFAGIRAGNNDRGARIFPKNKVGGYFFR